MRTKQKRISGKQYDLTNPMTVNRAILAYCRNYSDADVVIKLSNGMECPLKAGNEVMINKTPETTLQAKGVKAICYKEEEKKKVE